MNELGQVQNICASCIHNIALGLSTVTAEGCN